MTFDDLPFAAAHPASRSNADAAAKINQAILAGLARHHVPVTGFVIQKRVEELGIKDGTAILNQWTARGHDLANHTYSHPDINQLTVQQIEDEIVRGDGGRKPGFFRFPYNHTGDTREKHDAIAAFLEQHGYRLAPCTIDNSDYEFNVPYALMLEHHDRGAAKRLRAAYIDYTGAEIDYYSKLHEQVLGYQPPHIMLLHDNQLNADVIEEVIRLFLVRHYRFVSLAQAESDPAYGILDTFITKFGLMWGYRWAAERNVKVNGRLEPEPPEWIHHYESSVRDNK